MIFSGRAQGKNMSVTPDIPLASVFRQCRTDSFPLSVQTFSRGETIFFPGAPAEHVYFLLKGAVKLSRVYEAGEEITVALLRSNSVFGVLSLLTGQRSDRFYHAVAFTSVELLCAPIEQVERSLKNNPELSIFLLRGLSERILADRDDDRDVSTPRHGRSLAKLPANSVPRLRDSPRARNYS